MDENDPQVIITKKALLKKYYTKGKELAVLLLDIKIENKDKAIKVAREINAICNKLNSILDCHKDNAINPKYTEEDVENFFLWELHDE